MCSNVVSSGLYCLIAAYADALQKKTKNKALKMFRIYVSGIFQWVKQAEHLKLQIPQIHSVSMRMLKDVKKRKQLLF